MCSDKMGSKGKSVLAFAIGWIIFALSARFQVQGEEKSAKPPSANASVNADSQQMQVRAFVESLTGDDFDSSLRAGYDLLKNHLEATAEVIKAVSKKDYAVRKRATWSLTGAAISLDWKYRRKCDPVLRGLLPTLIEIARDSDTVERGSAGAWMGVLVGGDNASEEDRKKVVPVLTVLLRDKEFYTRWKAMEGVLRMGSAAKPLIPVVAERLTDSDPHIRRDACLALGEMGPDARAAIPALRKAMNDPEMKGFVQKALQKIESAPPAVKTR